MASCINVFTYAYIQAHITYNEAKRVTPSEHKLIQGIYVYTCCYVVYVGKEEWSENFILPQSILHLCVTNILLF